MLAALCSALLVVHMSRLLAAAQQTSDNGLLWPDRDGQHGCCRPVGLCHRLAVIGNFGKLGFAVLVLMLLLGACARVTWAVGY